MKAVIYLVNGNTLDLDEFATDMLLKNIHKGELGNSFTVIHFSFKTGKLHYSIPMSSVVYIEYMD